MNTQCIKTFVAGLVLTCMSMPLCAQDAGMVTILDVAKVFKENAGFETQMASIKREADALKVEIQGEQEKIRQEALGLQNFEVGSPDRNSLEGKLEQKQANLRTRARQSEQDLLKREAQIYYETYSKMQKVVASFAESNNIAVVLRFDSAAIDSTNRAEVIKGVNRSVVYHRNIDITTFIIQGMTTATANAGSQPRNN